MAKITVTAGEGRVTPLHRSIASGPGGTQMLLRPEDELEVDDADTHVQRALRNGDLVRVKQPRERPTGERFIARAFTLTGEGPPAVFGDLPTFDPDNQGPHTSAPRKGA